MGMGDGDLQNAIETMVTRLVAWLLGSFGVFSTHSPL